MSPRIARPYPRTLNGLSAAIGRAVQAQRQIEGLTQSQLARLLHVTPSRVWQLEHNYRGCFPSIGMLARIAKLLNCSVWLILMRAETGQF